MSLQQELWVTARVVHRQALLGQQVLQFKQQSTLQVLVILYMFVQERIPLAVDLM
jgi:hypothetical protein